MLIVRYIENEIVKDLEVGEEYAVDIFLQATETFGSADLIYIIDGVEHCIL